MMELQEHIIGSKTLRILQWETVCRLLGVESKEIESVKRDHPNDNVGAFRECLLIWHKRSSGVTWERLLEAVEKAGEKNLVDILKRDILLNVPEKALLGMCALYFMCCKLLPFSVCQPLIM